MIDPKMESSTFSPPGWRSKFRCAMVGLLRGARGASRSAGPNSFLVHVPCSVLVIVAGIWMKVGAVSMAILMTCIGMVFVAELINSSLEELAKAVTKEHDENVGAALDIAAGAVLVASLTALAVGGVIFVPRVFAMVGW